jgi:hypothetical protein
MRTCGDDNSISIGIISATRKAVHHAYQQPSHDERSLCSCQTTCTTESPCMSYAYRVQRTSVL